VLLERDGEGPGTIAEGGPVCSPLAVDHADPVGENRRGALEEGERRERREVDGLVHRRLAYASMAAISSMSETVLVEHDGVAGHITLNRPEKRNALSLELMQDLIAALERLGADRDVRAIVIEGAGPAFSAGHDLSEMVGRELPFYQRLFDVCTMMMETIHRLPQPVIAKVHGVATAAGCQLVAACDLAVAAADARFATPGVKIGLFCSTPMVPLSRAIGRKRALEMLLTGDLVDAETARDWGLVNHVVPAERLEEAVGELVAKIERSSPLTVGIGKEAFYAQAELDEHRAYDLAKAVMAMNSLAADAQEGMCAFLEKRDPTWRGA
jgi:enoyl-CoA hydratase/carnithine racemase